MHATTPTLSPFRWNVRASRTLLAVAIGATMTLAVAGETAQAPPSPEQRFQMALEAQSAREYRTMLALLREAGAAGHVQAQEMLGMVLLAGPVLYGQGIRSDRCEARHWAREAARQGSDIGAQQLHLLNRVRNAPTGRETVCNADRS